MSGKRLNKKPIRNLFSKIIVFYCVGCSTFFCFYAFRILSRTGNDATGILGITIGFFGGELMLMCMKAIFGRNKKGVNNESDNKEA